MFLTGADIVIKTLIEQGVNVVFGYPGGQILDIYDSLYKYSDEIEHILTAHEQGAAHAADGYARACKRPGVVFATSGPGATNLVTGIATAHLDSVPMIAITGNVPTYQIGYDSFQEIDITGVTLPITKHNYFVGRVEDLADTIREAFSLSMSGRPGPVLIDIPKDVQEAKCEFIPKPAALPEQKFAAKEERVIKAAEIINNCKKPYIYFGGGLISSDAKNEMLELSEKIDAFIGCSMMGISAVSTDNPRFLGMQGMHGHFASSCAMHNADCIISLGVRFNDRVIGNKEKFDSKAKIIHIDIDGSELSKTVVESQSLRGDVKETLKSLLPLINESKKPQWHHEVEKYLCEEKNASDNREGMTPKNILGVICKYLGDNTPVVTDVGQHQVWTAQYLSFEKNRRFISSGGLGTMGFGLGAAIGAHIASGEKTFLITGDGSFSMNINELITAVKRKIPVVIIIFNNGVLGMVRQWQTLFYDKHYSNTTLDSGTNFLAVSKAFGADGMKATNLAELESALDVAAKKNEPFVIDCSIDKDEFVLPMFRPSKGFGDIITDGGKKD